MSKVHLIGNKCNPIGFLFDGTDSAAHRIVTDGGQTVDDTASVPTLAGLTGFQRDLLAVIRLLDARSVTSSGQRIKETFAQLPHLDEPNHGRLYPNLDTLVDQGLVERGSYDRRTNIYRTTDRGRAALRARREFLDDVKQAALTDGGDGR